jgi:hypothetical protein
MKNSPINPNILKYSVFKAPVSQATQREQAETEPVDRFTPSDRWSHHDNSSITARLIANGIIGLKETSNIRTGESAEPAQSDPGQWDKRALRKMARMEGGHTGFQIARVLFGGNS